MKRWSVLTVVAALALSTAFATAQEEKAKKKEKKDPLKEAKCVVSGRAIDPEHSVAYKEGKVYFCCPNCPKAFEKDTAKFAPKANHQLVQTRQTRQVACPLTGRPINKDTRIRVEGAAVAFCCNNCKGKAEAAEGDEQIILIFSDEAFEKGFKVRQPKKKKANSDT